MPDEKSVSKITCPYNVAHEIVPERFQGHLFKCREQYKVSEYVPCPFNAAHDVPAPELQYHKQVCPDRFKIDKMMFRIGEVQDDVSNVIMPHIELPDETDDWDTPQPTASYLQIRDDIVENKPILRLPMGETKSKRKNFYQNEMFRFEEVNERAEEEPVYHKPKPAGRGVHVDRYFREPSPESRIGMGRGSSSRKPKTSIGEGSVTGGGASASISSLRRPFKEDSDSGGRAKKNSRFKEEPEDDNSDEDNDDGFQIVVRSKGRGRGKLK